MVMHAGSTLRLLGLQQVVCEGTRHVFRSGPERDVQVPCMDHEPCSRGSRTQQSECIFAPHVKEHPTQKKLSARTMLEHGCLCGAWHCGIVGLVSREQN